MPLSSFSQGLRDVVMFLPGTYGTSLLRNHALGGALKAITEELSYLPSSIVDTIIKGLKDTVDCNIYFFETKVEIWQMYLVLGVSIILLLGAYVLINVLSKKKN